MKDSEMVELAGETARHGLATRMVHMGLAAAVVVQLVTSLVIAAPQGAQPGDFWFAIHAYSGLAAFGFVLAFWLVAAVRRRGTPASRLFPWFDAARRAEAWADVVIHIRTLRTGRLPPYHEDAPFAAAVHGLGLVLMTAMAASGTLYWLAGGGDPGAGGAVFVAMLIHKPLANLAWVYLIGHAGVALVHHVTDHQPLGEMWSLAPARTPRNRR